MQLNEEAGPFAAGVNTLGGLLVEITPSLRATLPFEAFGVNTGTRFAARESRSAADYKRHKERHEQDQLRYLL